MELLALIIPWLSTSFGASSALFALGAFGFFTDAKWRSSLACASPPQGAYI